MTKWPRNLKLGPGLPHLLGPKINVWLLFFDFVFFNFKLYGNTFTSVATVAYTKVSFQIS